MTITDQLRRGRHAIPTDAPGLSSVLRAAAIEYPYQLRRPSRRSKTM